MNIVFVLMCAVSIVLLLFQNPNLILAAMLEGAGQAIDLLIKLCAVYCVWISVLEIMKETRISMLLSKAFSPVSKRLFRSETADTQGLISLCFATNMLGLGSAATPLGIAAMENMAKGRTSASKNMVMFLVINATSIQLLPATIIAMRTSHGSGAPSDIIIPSLIATTITTVVGIILVKVFVKNDNDNETEISENKKIRKWKVNKPNKTTNNNQKNESEKIDKKKEENINGESEKLNDKGNYSG